MVGQRSLPNLGLKNRWAVGTDGWGSDLNDDLAKLDALMFLAVLSVSLATPPTTPDEGDRYVVPAGATGTWAGNSNSVAVMVDAVWHFYPPRAGWLVHDNQTGSDFRYSGTAWSKAEQPFDLYAYIPAFGTVMTDPVFSLIVRRPIRFPVNLTGSAATARIAPAALSVLPIKRNGTQIGTVNFAASATTGTLTFASETVFALDDLLEIYPCNDTALKGVRLALVGYR